MSFKQEVLKLLNKYKSELDEGFLQAAWKEHVGKMEFGQFESYLAYCLVREYKPKIIIEVGCASGFSSYPLVYGVARNNCGYLSSFETNETRQEEYQTNMRRLGYFHTHCNISGDVRTYYGDNTAPVYIYKSIIADILFLDADHGLSFAQWYLRTLVPRISKLLYVHDIYYGEPQMAEAVEVLSWLDRNPQYEWVKSMDLAHDFGMVKVLSNDPVGSKNSGIWVKLYE